MMTYLQTTPPSSRPIQQPPLTRKEEASIARETGEFICPEKKTLLNLLVHLKTVLKLDHFCDRDSNTVLNVSVLFLYRRQFCQSKRLAYFVFSNISRVQSDFTDASDVPLAVFAHTRPP